MNTVHNTALFLQKHKDFGAVRLLLEISKEKHCIKLLEYTGALRHVPIALRETEEITEMYH